MTEEQYKAEYETIMKDIKEAKDKGENLDKYKARLRSLKIFYNTMILNKKEMDKLS